MTAPTQQPSPDPTALAPGTINVDSSAVMAALQSQIADQALNMAVLRARAEQAEATAAHLGARVRDLEAALTGEGEPG